MGNRGTNISNATWQGTGSSLAIFVTPEIGSSGGGFLFLGLEERSRTISCHTTPARARLSSSFLGIEEIIAVSTP